MQVFYRAIIATIGLVLLNGVSISADSNHTNSLRGDSSSSSSSGDTKADTSDDSPSPIIIPCGDNTCDTSAGELCCNPSCGLCAIDGDGDSCSRLFCEPPKKVVKDAPKRAAVLETGDEGECNSSLECPEHSSICRDHKCIAVVEEHVEFVSSKNAPAETKQKSEETKTGLIPCGENTCDTSMGEFCCNSSCGVCAPAGNSCSRLFCEPPKSKAKDATKKKTIKSKECNSNDECPQQPSICSGHKCVVVIQEHVAFTSSKTAPAATKGKTIATGN